MDVALSRTGRRLMRVFFALVIVFLYAPIAILLVFSFNKAVVPAFPLSGFTLHWYHEFIHNSSMRSALEASAMVAALSSVVAVSLGILASLAIARRSFRGKGLVTALLLTPLVIPFVVLGISSAALPRAWCLALPPDGGSRPRRDQPPVHDPRPPAAPPADRRFARGGCL